MIEKEGNLLFYFKLICYCLVELDERKVTIFVCLLDYR